VLISIVPALLLVIGCVTAWFYPLTRQRHAEISQQLALRRGTAETNAKAQGR
jgi:Na+/melibiose symporter-like transporter